MGDGDSKSIGKSYEGRKDGLDAGKTAVHRFASAKQLVARVWLAAIPQAVPVVCFAMLSPCLLAATSAAAATEGESGLQSRPRTAAASRASAEAGKREPSRPNTTTTARERLDLGPAFGQLACAGDLTSGPQAAWHAKVYDAQSDGQFLERRSGLPVSLKELSLRARSLAAVRRTGGYAYGLCPDASRGWVITTPAPVPAKVSARGVVSVPERALHERCEGVRADFAPRATGNVKKLALRPAGDLMTVETAKLGDGTLSITCQPRQPRWRGPVLWYLVPVGQGPAGVAPEAGQLSAETVAAQTSSLGDWINQLRRGEHLGPLKVATTPDALNEAALALAADASLNHDRELLRHVAGQLGSDDLALLGEDRVKGTNAKSMAWLLWNSPRHRELLLNPAATHLAMAARPDGAGAQLVVLITAKAEHQQQQQKPGEQVSRHGKSAGKAL